MTVRRYKVSVLSRASLSVRRTTSVMGVRVWRQNPAPQIARRAMRPAVTVINASFKTQSAHLMMIARRDPVLRVEPVTHGVRSVTPVVVLVIPVSKIRAWERILKVATLRVAALIKPAKFLMMSVSLRSANAEALAGYAVATAWGVRVLIAHVSARTLRAVLRRVVLRGMPVNKGQGALHRLVHVTKRLGHGTARAIVAEGFVYSCRHSLA